jgi:hypothetical protein
MELTMDAKLQAKLAERKAFRIAQRKKELAWFQGCTPEEEAEERAKRQAKRDYRNKRSRIEATAARMMERGATEAEIRAYFREACRGTRWFKASR